jgi:hypothetical protein
VAIYETISDTGFVVGRFDPHDEAEDMVDSEIGLVSLSKAGMGDFWAEAAKKVNEGQGWTGDKKKGKGGSHSVADYRKKRMDKIAMAQVRRDTKMPASLMASHLMPKSTAGKVALATVPAALAIRYNQQASDAAERVKGAVRGGYQKSRDTRHYRPASPYYDDYLGKSSEYSTEALAIIDAWISKAGGPIIGNKSWGQGLGPPTNVPPPPPANDVKPTYKRPSKRKIRLAEWEAGGGTRIFDPTKGAPIDPSDPTKGLTGEIRNKTPAERERYRQRHQLKEPLELKVRRVAPKARTAVGEALLGKPGATAGAARTGGALRGLGTHLGTHAAVYAPMAFGATSAGIAGIAARRQAKAAKKTALIEEAARKVRNKKLAIGAAASLPLLALAANKKPVEKSDLDVYMDELEKGIIGAARDARFIRRANRLGANIPPQMTFSEKWAANRASRKAAGAEHRARRHKFSQNIPTGAPPPNAPTPPATGFWGKLNQGINEAGTTATNTAQHIGNVRGALGLGAPAVKAPPKRLGLTTGQQIALGGAGAAGLYGGMKLREQKPAAYQ